MFRMLKTRLDQGYRTFPFPEAEPSMPESYQGLPVTRGTCPAGCRACLEVCPTGAIRLDGGAPAVDLGRCVFCGACAEGCRAGVVEFTRNFRMAVSRREDLVVKGAGIEPASGLDEKRRSLFGRSLKLRQVSAGAATPAKRTPTSSARWFTTSAGSGSSSWPRRAMRTGFSSPVPLPKT